MWKRTQPPTSRSLVELAGSWELMVVRDEEGWQMLVKKASIINQVVVPRTAREMVMKYAHTDHLSVSATLQEIKRRCY